MRQNYISQLKQLLSATGFSQAELAKRLGVTFAALNRWLHEYAKPRQSRIEAIRKLHQQLVGFPSITESELRQWIRRADALRRKGLWAALSRRPELQEELLLEHTYNSTSIEGTTFTKRETEKVIFHKGWIPDKPLQEHLEVVNHAAVLRELFRGERHSGPVTERMIKELHHGLMQGIREDAGEYSRHPRVIRGLDIALTHPKDIPEEMGRLLRSWRGEPSRKTVREIALFHAQFELIHPFGDGNGRVGRLLMILQCLKWDFPPAVIENDRKIEYYDVLEHAQRKSEWPLVRFLVQGMEKTARILRKYRIR